MNKLNKSILTQNRLIFFNFKKTNSTNGSEKIKVEWKKYDWSQFDKKNSFLNQFSSKSYKEQLEIKKEKFAEAFRNVLITLSYDEKLEDDFKYKQQEHGQRVLSHTQDIVPLSGTKFKEILTQDVLMIRDDDVGCKKVGKYIRVNTNAENESKNEEDEDQTEEFGEANEKSLWTSELSKQHENDYPEDFINLSKHFEEFLKSSPYPPKKYLSYYTKIWNWSIFELRRTSKSQNMLIVPFNPQSLSSDELARNKDKLKHYFINGPGKESNLHSLYIHYLDPLHEFNNDKERYELIMGADRLVEKCDGKEFSFFADNTYPGIFEAYEKLNQNLALMLEEAQKENKTDILLELDGANGVLGTLASKNYSKFYAIQNSANTNLNTRINLESHGLKEFDYFKLFFNVSKSYKHLKSILSHNDENWRISFVYQDFKQPMFAYEKKHKKKFLIQLRQFPQIKTILLVTNVSALFKLEQYCYELMTGERKKDGIVGRPFTAVSARLVDSKPNVANCYIIIRLDRE